ncbi:MAG TPA: isoprenylcysteine carboxylmethyltransferase family protein [Bacteroidales bacterium]|nr:isoprenylcysteine carboxylmethyltransferase family protein [Bacteroidales bacterium]
MNYITLATGTILIMAFSWFFSLREKRYHGIARFFSFESIFILLLLNLKVWFKNPFSAYQVISWIFLFASIYPGIAGFLTLHRKGSPEENHIERTTVLVKTGIYKYIRHPLYCSLFLLGTGIVFKEPARFQLLLGAINLLAVYFTARMEEKEMIKKFGPEYIEYMHGTRMFIPYVL